eukprot:scaffold86678_cov37-Prasinocladus_malaysianus.AAC.1
MVHGDGLRKVHPSGEQRRRAPFAKGKLAKLPEPLTVINCYQPLLLFCQLARALHGREQVPGQDRGGAEACGQRSPGGWNDLPGGRARPGPGETAMPSLRSTSGE